MKANKNSKIEFQQGIKTNSIYTILSFQKKLVNEINRLNDENMPKYVSVIMSFNHELNLIDRFLVNYGGSYNDKITKADYSDLQYNLNKTGLTLDKAIDGKFSKKFFHIFLINLLVNRIINKEPNYGRINDMRRIAEFKYANSSYLRSEEIDVNIKNNIDYSQPLIINVPERLYNKTIEKALVNFFPLIRIEPYKLSELPLGFKFIQRNINSSNFINNIELQDKIIHINNRIHS